MKDVMMYIIGVVVCSGLFTVFYRTVLHERSSFRTARMFLLGALVAAIVIPAFDIPVWRSAPVEIPVILLQSLPTPEAPIVNIASPQSIDWLRVSMWVLYGAGVAALGAIMIYQVAIISRMRRRAEVYRMGGCRIAVSEEVSAPFSFLSTVYVESGMSADEMRQIVLHESSHIRHRHSVEKIIMEVLKSLLWFNPFAWWASRLLDEVHEFEADRDVLRGGFSLEEYLPVIFRQIFGYIPEISVGLGNSLTKKRFLMMKKEMKQSKLSWLRAVGVLPLAAGGMLLFGFTHRAPEIIIAGDQPEVKFTTTFVPDDPTSAAKPKFTTTFESAVPAPDVPKPGIGKNKDVVVLSAETIYIYPDESRLMVFGDFKKDSLAARISSVSVIEDNIRQDSSTGGYTLRFGEKVDLDNVVLKEKPLYVLGNENREITPKEFQNMTSDQVKSITVLKDQAASEIYGERGKNGVVIITQHKDGEAKNGQTFTLHRNAKATARTDDGEVKVIGYGTQRKVDGAVTVSPESGSVKGQPAFYIKMQRYNIEDRKMELEEARAELEKQRAELEKMAKSLKKREVEMKRIERRQRRIANN